MKLVIAGFIGALLIVAGAAPAGAEPIVVTSGTFSSDNDVSQLMLLSDLFDLNLGGFGHEMTASGQLFPDGMAQVTTTFSGSVLGNGTITGVNYAGTGAAPFGSQPLSGTANLLFATAPFAWPGGLDFQTTVPFTLTGTLQLSSASGPVLNTNLLSSGTLTYNANGVSLSGSSFGVDIVGLTFAEQTPQSPTPEPATLMLLGTGLVGLVVGRRRGSSAKRH